MLSWWEEVRGACSNRIDHCILHRECIWKVMHGLDDIVADDDFHDVEPDPDRRVPGVAEVAKGGLADPLAFPAVDGGGGAEPLAFGSGLHLDEHLPLVITGDQVHLAGFAAVVGGEDLESGGLEMIGGRAFTEGSALEVRRALEWTKACPNPDLNCMPAPPDHRVKRSNSGCLSGAKLRRWMGQGPRRAMAARCSAVG